MDQARIELSYRLEHRHADGDWSPMVEDRTHHDPAGHDPERSWGRRLLFRCSRCDETAVVTRGDDGDVVEGHAGP